MEHVTYSRFFTVLYSLPCTYVHVRTYTVRVRTYVVAVDILRGPSRQVGLSFC